MQLSVGNKGKSSLCPSQPPGSTEDLGKRNVAPGNAGRHKKALYCRSTESPELEGTHQDPGVGGDTPRAELSPTPRAGGQGSRRPGGSAHSPGAARLAWGFSSTLLFSFSLMLVKFGFPPGPGCTIWEGNAPKSTQKRDIPSPQVPHSCCHLFLAQTLSHRPVCCCEKVMLGQTWPEG